MLSVALVGPSGIGKVHAREFFRAGAPVTAVLASTRESSENAARELSDQFGETVTAYSDLRELATAPVDAAVICSPPAAHLEAIKVLVGTERYVLCEKPLFWQDGLTTAKTRRICDELSQLAGGRLLVNTNNTWFPEVWFQRFGKPQLPREFGFHFHTTGQFQHDEIGVDLLPHALSILSETFTEDDPDDEITDIEKTVSANRYECRFSYRGVRCQLDLREDPDGERRLGFRVDDTGVEQIQRIENGEYRVYLAPAESVDDAFQVTDPFEISIRRFVDGAVAGQRFDREMADATKVMTMMTQILMAP